MHLDTVDKKQIEIYSRGLNVYLWLWGPKGGLYGQCVLDLDGVNKLLGSLIAHREYLTEALTESP